MAIVASSGRQCHTSSEEGEISWRVAVAVSSIFSLLLAILDSVSIMRLCSLALSDDELEWLE